MSQRIKLLTYPMALAVNPPSTSSVWERSSAPGKEGPSSSLEPRRWVRQSDELCVSGMFRSSRILTEYVAKYKFDDPAWKPLLDLPCGNAIGMEMRARHCNTALRHIVQKGHAMYFVFFTQHSVFHPRGLIEQSHVTCSIGVKGERLRTNIIHEGPLDIRDPMGPRGVLGVSQAEGYATWFQRKDMLWRRSRRIGALQAHLGAFDWTMCAPSVVGRKLESEVMLLEPHMKSVAGGLDVTGIVASTLLAQHPHLYVGEFDAPAITAVEAVQQAAYVTASRNKLVRSAAKGCDGEGLFALGWTTRTPPPYIPLEADLPFKLQMSRPQVFHRRSEYPNTLVGAPFVDSAPVMMMEYNCRQGAEHYLYDDAPSSRPLKWWSQPSNSPYSGAMYFAREGNLDQLVLREELRNPFDKKERKKPLYATTSPSARAKGRLLRYKKREK